jgi:hypothetical protein
LAPIQFDHLHLSFYRFVFASNSDCFPQLPGHPPITEPRFPLPVGKPYYEGKGLLRRGKERLIGRVDECVELQWMIQDLLIGTSQMTALAISGMGGIG